MKAVVEQTGLARYGELESFSWDSKRNELSCKLMLKGEINSLDISLNLEKNALGHLVIYKAETSREWLSLLLKDLIENSLVIELPEKISKYLKFIGL
jgi:hypothetical protein